MTCIRSSSTSNGSRVSAEGRASPRSLDNGCKAVLLEFTENLLKQCFLVEQAKILPDVGQIYRVSVSADQGSDVHEVLPAARIVNPALQLQCDQPFGAHNVQCPEKRLQLGSRLQQLTGDGS